MSRRVSIAVAVLAAVFYTWCTVDAARALDRTADEATYFNASRLMQLEGWEHPNTRLHGPVCFALNQLWVDEVPDGGLDPDGEVHPYLFRARLGLVPLGWLGLWVTWAWTRRLFGSRAAALATALFATTPVLVGYGSLSGTDMAATATALWTFYRLWRFVLEPSAGRAAWVGLALGVTLATKYLVLLFAPWVLLGVVWAAGPGWKRRLGWTLLFGATALATLHATYGFRGGFGLEASESYASRPLAGVAALPGGRAALALLPGVFLRGVDAQLGQVDAGREIFLDGEFARGHGDYYLWIWLYKTPELTLAFTALALLWAFLRGVRGRWSAKERALFGVLLPPLVTLLLVVSTTGLQLGPRYALFAWPALILLSAGALAARATAVPKLALAAATLVVAFQALETARFHPNELGYLNRLSGGPIAGYRHFSRSACDWGQLARDGLERLRREEAPFEVLSTHAGPRLGRVAIHLGDLVQADPADPTRARHWLDPFDPVAHAGSAWWIFEPDEATWEAAATDGRRSEELATALLGAGRRDAAAERIRELTTPGATHLRALLDEESKPLVRARAWMSLGRADRAHDEIADTPGFEALLVRVEALEAQGRTDEARTLAESVEGGHLPELARAALALALVRLGSEERALELLEGDSDVIVTVRRTARQRLDARRERQALLDRLR